MSCLATKAFVVSVGAVTARAYYSVRTHPMLSGVAHHSCFNKPAHVLLSSTGGKVLVGSTSALINCSVLLCIASSKAYSS